MIKMMISIGYVDDDDDDDLYGNSTMCFCILHNPIYMEIWGMGKNSVPLFIPMSHIPIYMGFCSMVKRIGKLPYRNISVLVLTS